MAALGNRYNGAGTVTPWGGYQLECVCVCVCGGGLAVDRSRSLQWS